MLKDNFFKKLTLYILIPLFLVALVVLIIEETRKPPEDSNAPTEAFLIDSPYSSKYMTKEIGRAVYKNAEKYLKENTVYKQGGKGVIEKTTYIDCSGLVIACYNKALDKTKFKLPFSDVSSQSLFSNYITLTNKVYKGDLIFFSYREDKVVNHVGIVKEIKDDTVYFIDAIPNEENDNGKAVNIRSYKTSDNKIVGYGVMKLLKNN